MHGRKKLFTRQCLQCDVTCCKISSRTSEKNAKSRALNLGRREYRNKPFQEHATNLALSRLTANRFKNKQCICMSRFVLPIPIPAVPLAHLLIHLHASFVAGHLPVATINSTKRACIPASCAIRNYSPRTQNTTADAAGLHSTRF